MPTQRPFAVARHREPVEPFVAVQFGDPGRGIRDVVIEAKLRLGLHGRRTGADRTFVIAEGGDAVRSEFLREQSIRVRAEIRLGVAVTVDWP